LGRLGWGWGRRRRRQQAEEEEAKKAAELGGGGMEGVQQLWGRLGQMQGSSMQVRSSQEPCAW